MMRVFDCDDAGVASIGRSGMTKQDVLSGCVTVPLPSRLLNSLWFRGLVLFGLGLLMVWLVSVRRPVAAFRPPLPPLPQDPLIQVYFNQSQASFYTEPYRQQQRLGDDLEQVIIEAIDSAQVSVELAVQEFNLPGIAQALIQRQQAGVPVRVIVENEYRQSLSQLTPQQVSRLDDRDRKKYQEFVQLVDLNRDGQLASEELAQRDAIGMLENARIPLIDDTHDGSRGSGLMHHKFVVIDGKTVLTGSVNFSWSEAHGDFLTPESLGNANHLLKIQSGRVAQLFTQEFNQMWGNNAPESSKFGLKKPYRPPQTVSLAPNSSITVQFSPTSTRQPWQQSGNGLIGRALSQASQSIDLALFVFSDQQLSNILEVSHRKGVAIRALIDPQFAFREYSEGLDMMGIALPDKKCRIEAGNRPWKPGISTVGIPTLPQGDILHHKVGIVDRRWVITGSQNWSEAANTTNDETLLVIDNPTVAAHFQREFDRLYSTAILGRSPSLERRLRERSQCRS